MILRLIKGEAMGAAVVPDAVESSVLPPPVVVHNRWVRIRPYELQDRAAIRRICCDTGYLGNPVEPIFRDRDLFADLFTKAYLDYAPDWALVAESEGRVVGYLLGSACKHFELLLMRSGFQTMCRMIFRLLTGKYRDHPESARFVRWLLCSAYHEQPRHPPGAADLHLDLAEGYRGCGIGRRLWQTYEHRLRTAGIAQCYGAFLSHPDRRPETVYVRFGFRVFDRRRTTIFDGHIREPVEVVSMTKRL